MKLSKELQLLIEAIKIVLTQNPDATAFKVLCEDDLNWTQVKKLLFYHQLHPIFFEAAQKISFSNPIVETSERIARYQAIKNLHYGVEATRVLQLLASANIVALPYKGLLFIEKMYANHSLRQIGDLDILVHPSQAKEALHVLVNDGYQLAIEHQPTDKVLGEIIKTTPNTEVGLDKHNAFGFKVHIDFHWGINEQHHYTINLKEIFETAQIGNFQNKKLLIPSVATMYKMLLNHHGGRECWVRLKDIADLIAFRKSFPNLDSNDLRNISAELKMAKLSDIGDDLRKFVVSNEIPKSTKTLSKIVYMWEYATHWDKVVPKVLLMRIYRKVQDEPMSWLKLINAQMIFHSKRSLSENKRLVVFPERLVFLNASSKLLSYFVRMYLKPTFNKPK